MAAAQRINAVRRLVLDPAPVMQTWVAYGLWLVIAALAAGWMTGHGDANPMMIFSASVSTLTFVVKIKTWETLPVSRWELGRAQWWYLLGRPFLLATASTGLAAGIDAAFGWLHMAPADIAAFLAAELALLTLIGVAQPVGAALAPVFGAAGNLVAIMVPFVIAMALAFHWTLKDGFFAARGEMLTGGAIALGVAAAAYGLTPWIPLARNQLLARPGPRPVMAGKSASERPTATASRPRAGGWALFLPLFTKGLQIVALCALAAGALALPQVRAIAARAMPSSDLLLFLPLIGAISAMTLTTTAPQRVLAGLPLSALNRTVPLVAVPPAVQLSLAAVILVAANVMTKGQLDNHWLVQLGMSELGGLALAAASLPMTLRFGQKGPMMMVLVWIPLGAISGVVTSLSMAHKAYGLVLPSTVVTLVVLLLASWLWTWWEIAYGRAIYRQWTWQPVSWRGQ